MRFVLAVICILAGTATAADDIVLIRMTTSLGIVDLEINVAAAPLTASNFLRLVDGGHLDGGSFYRTVSPANDNGSPVISVIQGGRGNAGSPFEPIAHETTVDTGLQHVDGAISMARGPVGTASTEFFICIGRQPALDFGGRRNADRQGFAVFGRVVSGMDVVNVIHRQPANASTESAYLKGQIFDEHVDIESVERMARPQEQSGEALKPES